MMGSVIISWIDSFAWRDTPLLSVSNDAFEYALVNTKHDLIGNISYFISSEHLRNIQVKKFIIQYWSIQSV
jgi:pantothenate kinase